MAMIETIALAISRTEIELAAARRPSKRAGIHRTGLADLDHLPASRQIVDQQFVDRLDTDDRLDLGPRHGERSYLSQIGNALPCRRRFEGHADGAAIYPLRLAAASIHAHQIHWPLFRRRAVESTAHHLDLGLAQPALQIGRDSCRERGRKYV